MRRVLLLAAFWLVGACATVALDPSLPRCTLAREASGALVDGCR